jgi:hypothetical protein
MLPAVEKVVELPLFQRMYRSDLYIIGVQFGTTGGASSRWREGVSTAKGGGITTQASLSLLVSLSFLKNINVLW